jgi:hypothetical protein
VDVLGDVELFGELFNITYKRRTTYHDQIEPLWSCSFAWATPRIGTSMAFCSVSSAAVPTTVDSVGTSDEL